MPARWLIDGMNLIGSRPDGWWRDRAAAMRRLVAELEAFAEATGEKVTVLLDGRPLEPPLDATTVTVAFASRSGRDAADDDIARHVAGDPEPGSLRVVTSDEALAERVREHGAEVHGAGGFRRRLDEILAERP